MTNHIERTKRMIEVMQAYVDGDEVESCTGEEWWVNEHPVWNWPSVDYRIAKTPDTINWDHVAPEFKYMARDDEGYGLLFKLKPRLGKYHWVSSYSMYAGTFSSYRKGTTDWKDSLVIRPGCE